MVIGRVLFRPEGEIQWMKSGFFVRCTHSKWQERVISTGGRNLVNEKWISRREAPRNDKRESFRPWAERMGRNPVNVKWISRSLHSFGMMERWISQSLHSFEMTRMWISRLLHSLEMAWKMTYFYKKMIFYEKIFWKMKKFSDFWSKIVRKHTYFNIK